MKPWRAKATGWPSFTIVVEGVTSACREICWACRDGIRMAAARTIWRAERARLSGGRFMSPFEHRCAAGANSEPQRLKPAVLFHLGGTSELVPFPVLLQRKLFPQRLSGCLRFLSYRQSQIEHVEDDHQVDYQDGQVN